MTNPTKIFTNFGSIPHWFCAVRNSPRRLKIRQILKLSLLSTLTPDSAFTISGIAAVDAKVPDNVKQIFASGRPLAYGTGLYTDFPSYNGTPVPYVDSGKRLMNKRTGNPVGHCMLIIGYDDTKGSGAFYICDVSLWSKVFNPKRKSKANSSMTNFIPGLKLSELFYTEAAKPILETLFPQISHSAALIGWGSEVLGYDDIQSSDHHWGPRFLLFLSPANYQKYKTEIGKALSDNLPHRFRGYATNYGDPDEVGVRLPKETAEGPHDHSGSRFSRSVSLSADVGTSAMSWAQWSSPPVRLRT